MRSELRERCWMLVVADAPGDGNGSGFTDWEYWFLSYMALYLLIYNGWGSVIMNEVGG